MRIERLTAAGVSPHLVAEMNRLLPQLSPSASAMTLQRLNDLLEASGVHVFAAWEDDVLAGMLTLIIAPIPTGFHGYIEDVVVDAAFRGRGIAEELRRAKRQIGCMCASALSAGIRTCTASRCDSVSAVGGPSIPQDDKKRGPRGGGALLRFDSSAGR